VVVEGASAHASLARARTSLRTSNCVPVSHGADTGDRKMATDPRKIWLTKADLNLPPPDYLILIRTAATSSRGRGDVRPVPAIGGDVARSAVECAGLAKDSGGRRSARKPQDGISPLLPSSPSTDKDVAPNRPGTTSCQRGWLWLSLFTLKLLFCGFHCPPL
jgi:hypothetical protein